MLRSSRGRVMLRRCMMFGRMVLGASMMLAGTVMFRSTMMFRDTMVFSSPVMLGRSMTLRSSMLVSVMLRGSVLGGSMFRPFMFGFMRCLGQRRFPRVTFVLTEFLGVIVHGVTLMSALFLG